MTGQEKKVAGAIDTLQKNTGYKLRVLLQSYPNTPGIYDTDNDNNDDDNLLYMIFNNLHMVFVWWFHTHMSRHLLYYRSSN